MTTILIGALTFLSVLAFGAAFAARSKPTPAATVNLDSLRAEALRGSYLEYQFSYKQRGY